MTEAEGHSHPPESGTRNTAPGTARRNREPDWRVRARPESIWGQVRDSWRHRRLFPFFLFNAIRSAYQAAILGTGWLIIRPFIMAMIAVVVMRDMLGVSTAPIPYLLYVLVGFSLWIVFQRGMAWGTRSFQRNKALLSRFTFPPLLIHISALGPGLTEGTVVFTIATITAVVYMMIDPAFRIMLGWHTLAVIPAGLLALLLVIGVTSFTSVLNNMARDVWYTLRFVLMVWTFATPVYYPRSAVPAPYDEYMLYNPMTPIVELYRWGLFHTEPMRWDALAIAVGVIAVLLLFGLWVFAKLERRSLGLS